MGRFSIISLSGVDSKACSHFSRNLLKHKLEVWNLLVTYYPWTFWRFWRLLLKAWLLTSIVHLPQFAQCLFSSPQISKWTEAIIWPWGLERRSLGAWASKWFQQIICLCFSLSEKRAVHVYLFIYLYLWKVVLFCEYLTGFCNFSE